MILQLQTKHTLKVLEMH